MNSKQLDEGKILVEAFDLIRKAEELIAKANREVGKIGLMVLSDFTMRWMFSVDKEYDNTLLERLQTWKEQDDRLAEICKRSAGPEKPARKAGKNQSSKRR